MYSPHINEYKDLFVESHFLEKEIQKKIEEKELNNMLTTEIHKRIKKEHKKKPFKLPRKILSYNQPNSFNFRILPC